MKRPNNLLHSGTVALLAASALFLGSRWANAYAYIEYCGGDPVQKDSGPLKETRNRCSIPDGSPYHNAYTNAVSLWGAVSGLGVSASYVNNNCSVDIHDWSNEIATTPRANIDDNNGMTYYAHENICFADFGPGDYGATDSFIAQELWFTAPDPAALMNCDNCKGSGQTTLIHEIGHQHGLGHSRAFNMMNAGQAKPNAPGGPQPFPDDIRGANNLYGNRTWVDLTPTNQYWDTTSAKTLQITSGLTITTCKSSWLTSKATVLNVGHQTQKFTHRVRFSESTSDPNVRVRLTMTFADVTLAAQSSLTQGFSVPLDNLTPGRTYYMWHTVNTGNTVAESDLGDNWLRYLGSVEPLDC